MTLLEAVNLSLRSTGESTVDTLDSNHPQVQTILASIEDMNRLRQRRGWYFNQGRMTLESSPAFPHNGRVIVPENIELVVPVRYLDLSVRKLAGFRYLFDERTGDYWLDKSVEVDYRSIVPFEDLPDAMQDYVASSAALDYAANYDADQLTLAKIKTRMDAAYAAVNSDHIRLARVNRLYDGSVGVKILRAFGGRYGRM